VAGQEIGDRARVCGDRLCRGDGLDNGGWTRFAVRTSGGGTARTGATPGPGNRAKDVGERWSGNPRSGTYTRASRPAGGRFFFVDATAFTGHVI